MSKKVVFTIAIAVDSETDVPFSQLPLEELQMFVNAAFSEAEWDCCPEPFGKSAIIENTEIVEDMF